MKKYWGFFFTMVTGLWFVFLAGLCVYTTFNEVNVWKSFWNGILLVFCIISAIVMFITAKFIVED